MNKKPLFLDDGDISPIKVEQKIPKGNVTRGSPIEALSPKLKQIVTRPEHAPAPEATSNFNQQSVGFSGDSENQNINNPMNMHQVTNSFGRMAVQTSEREQPVVIIHDGPSTVNPNTNANSNRDDSQ